MKAQLFENLVAEVEEEVYEASDWATGSAVDVLLREGQKGMALEVLSQHGAFMGDWTSMDPMDVLILLEEHGESE